MVFDILLGRFFLEVRAPIKTQTNEAIKSNKSLNETQKERSLKINELIAKLKEIDVKAKPLGDKLKEILGENGGDYE